MLGDSRPTEQPDTDALREVPQRIVKAWADNDADAFAEVFTEDATLILPGDVFIVGKEDIRSFMAAGYAGPYRDTRVHGVPVSVKLLGSQSAVLVTEGGVLASGDETVAPERAIRATWVLVERDGQWLITSYQNTPVKTP